MGRPRGTTHKETDFIEKRAKPPSTFPTKAECAAMRAPPKNEHFAKPRKPMLANDERYYLQRASGEFLHMACLSFTQDKRRAYCGSKSQIENLKKKVPEYARLNVVPYRVVMGIGTAGSESSY